MMAAAGQALRDQGVDAATDAELVATLAAAGMDLDLANAELVKMGLPPIIVDLPAPPLEPPQPPPPGVPDTTKS